MIVTPVAKVPSAFRKSRGSIAELSLANSLAGSGSVGCFGASFISPASKGQVFGREAERDAAVIGGSRIEIERDVRIDGVGIAKLPLQSSCGEQSPRAAGREQQRYGFRAEIDGISSIASHFGLGGHVRNVATPGIGHCLDACRAHDQTGCIDLRGSFSNLDLRALKVA